MKDPRVTDEVKMDCWKRCPHEAFPSSAGRLPNLEPPTRILGYHVRIVV
jgi:hypothetical protein